MPQTIDIEVFLAGAYAVFLLLVALGLELVTRHAHHRSRQMRIAGFRYHHDFWECPAGQQLKPIATDYAPRLVRYRAPAHICNACSIKHLCTESEEGREIEHNPDSWLESEIAPFPSRYLASFTVFGRAAIGGGDDPAPEADGVAHPQRIPRTNCGARIAIVVSISCSTAGSRCQG